MITFIVPSSYKLKNIFLKGTVFIKVLCYKFINCVLCTCIEILFNVSCLMYQVSMLGSLQNIAGWDGKSDIVNEGDFQQFASF